MEESKYKFGTYEHFVEWRKKHYDWKNPYDYIMIFCFAGLFFVLFLLGLARLHII